MFTLTESMVSGRYLSCCRDTFYLAVLQMRIYAMYTGSKKVLSLILISFLGATAAALVLVQNMLQEDDCSSLRHRSRLPDIDYLLLPVIAFPLLEGETMCVPTGIEDWNRFWLFWIPILSYESLLFSLALLKGFQCVGEDLISPRNVLRILISDSILYFFSCVTLYLSSSLSLKKLVQNIRNISCGPSDISIVSIFVH